MSWQMMNGHIYIREPNRKQVLRFLCPEGIKRESEMVSLSEVVLQPDKMRAITERLTGREEGCIPRLIIQDDLTNGGIEDLEKLFPCYFSSEQLLRYANSFLTALKYHTTEVEIINRVLQERSIRTKFTKESIESSLL